MTSVELTSEESRGVARVAFRGELDISGAPKAERLLRRVERKKPGVLVLDLRGLTFMDSTGLRVVVGADARARREGRRLLIVRGPESVHRVFRLTLLDRRLEFVDDPSSIGGDGGGEP